MAQSSPPPSFDSYNMHCFRDFPSEQGLCAHLWHRDSCKKYLSLQRPYASCWELVADESQRRLGFGVQSTRLNPTMSIDAPLFSPYDKFDYDAFFDGLLDNDDLALRTENDGFLAGIDDNEDNEVLLLVADDEPADKLFASAALIDESCSSPAITALMEQIKARDCTALAAMQQDVEHQCLYNILKVSEDAQCLNNMLCWFILRITTIFRM